VSPQNRPFLQHYQRPASAAADAAGDDGSEPGRPMVSGPLTDGCEGLRAMLIVCPSCATSYMIDPASVGAAGRMVRCARCRETWFAGPNAGEVNAFVDSVIAEAESETKPASPPPPAQTAAAPPPPPPPAAQVSEPPLPPPSVSLPSWTPGTMPVEPPAPEPEPVAINDAPSLVPPIEDAPPSAGRRFEPENEDIETFAARRRRMQSKRQKSKRSSRWTAVILVLFAFNVALIGARHEVVRYLPQTASLFAAIGLPVNLRNLNFENVRITKEIEDGNAILVVQGSIVSASRKPAEVPRLRFAARNTSGQEIYVWTAKPERSILGPGESMKFSSRLAAPPPDANDVMVRFFTAQDAMAGGNK
jgi:predicted Zn finger-like uncharacterized protein